MSRIFTLDALVLRCKQRADLVNHANIGDPEWKENISTLMGELHSILAAAGSRQYESVQSISSSGLTAHGDGGGYVVLTSDHLSTTRVEYEESGGRRHPLFELMAQETYTQSGPSGGERAYAYALVGANLVLYPSPPAGQTYQHHYVPQPADLSAASGSTNVDVVTPKGEDMVIWGVAVMARAKQDLPAVLHQAKYEEARRHVEEWATLRNLHETKRRVIDDGWGANPLYRRW